MVLVLGMDEDEWADVVAGGETAEVLDRLSGEERGRVRGMMGRWSRREGREACGGRRV